MLTYTACAPANSTLQSTLYQLRQRAVSLNLWTLLLYVTENYPDVESFRLGQSDQGDYLYFWDAVWSDGRSIGDSEGEDGSALGSALEADIVDELAGCLSETDVCDWSFVTGVGGGWKFDVKHMRELLAPLITDWFDPPPEDMTDLDALERWLAPDPKESPQ